MISTISAGFVFMSWKIYVFNLTLNCNIDMKEKVVSLPVQYQVTRFLTRTQIALKQMT
jgi:hypothetical protein